MFKRIAIGLVAVVLLLTTVQVFAITNGGPDGDDHPFVGLAVMFDADGNPLWRCSGTLIAPKVYLTAGHCTEAPAASALIWFDEDVQSIAEYPFGGEDASGTTYVHPDFNPNAFYLYDLGVIVLDRPMRMSEYGELPELGVLDDYATARGQQDTTITAVGYGLQRINPVFVEAQRIRLQATLNLVDLNGTAGIPSGTSVMVSGNANTGGTCFGDSGGPQFLNDTNIIVAVTSFGLNGNCAGVGGGYRVDQADDLNWLYSEFGKLLRRR